MKASASGWNTAQADAEQALLVADLQLALGEEIEELAVAPELVEAQRSKPRWGTDRDLGGPTTR